MNVREHRNGQSRETGNTGHIRHRTKTNKRKQTPLYASKHKSRK